MIALCKGVSATLLQVALLLVQVMRLTPVADPRTTELQRVPLVLYEDEVEVVNPVSLAVTSEGSTAPSALGVGSK